MSQPPAEPMLHFIAGPRWFARRVGAVAACGEPVAYIRAARNPAAVECPGCQATREFVDAVMMRIAEYGRSWGMRRGLPA